MPILSASSRTFEEDEAVQEELPKVLVQHAELPTDPAKAPEAPAQAELKRLDATGERIETDDRLPLLVQV